jgi:hypothetical protein
MPSVGSNWPAKYHIPPSLLTRSKFFIRPQLLIRLEPLPIGRDISPTDRRYRTSAYVVEGSALTARRQGIG